MGTVTHCDFPSQTKKTESKADSFGNSLENIRQLGSVDTIKIMKES